MTLVDVLALACYASVVTMAAKPPAWLVIRWLMFLAKLEERCKRARGRTLRTSYTPDWLGRMIAMSFSRKVSLLRILRMSFLRRHGIIYDVRTRKCSTSRQSLWLSLKKPEIGN